TYDHGLRILDAKTGKERATWQPDEKLEKTRPVSFAVTADQRLAAVQWQTGDLTLHDVREVRLENARRLEKSDREGGLAISGKGTVLARLAFDSLQVWELPAAKLLGPHRLPDARRSYSVKLSPDGRLAALVGSGETVHLMDLATGATPPGFKPFSPEK